MRENRRFSTVVTAVVTQIVAAVVFLAICADSAICAPGEESWGAKMFPVKRHNFGRVALQANAEYVFELENIWEEDVRIVGVYSSCTCTSVSVNTKKLKSLEKAEVLAKLNTTGQHTKNVGATLTVILETKTRNKERGGENILHDEVQLEVKGYIRPDVVMTPGVVEFGSVPLGKSVSRSVRLEYAGTNEWQLTRMLRSSPYVYARAEEVRRANGEIVYDVVVTLNRKKDAPEGYIRDVLHFVTNETPVGQKEPTALTLPIQAAVVSPLQAKPSPFLIGVLHPGEKVMKSLVIRNDLPFRVQSVTSPDKRFRFTFSDQESPVHMISVLFATGSPDQASPDTSPLDNGENIAQKIYVRTNLDEDEPIVVDVQGRLFPASPENVSVTDREPQPEPPVMSTPEPVVRFTAPSLEATEEAAGSTGASDSDSGNHGEGRAVRLAFKPPSIESGLTNAEHEAVGARSVSE